MNKALIIRLVTAGLMIIVGAIIYIISRNDIIFLDWIPHTIIEKMRHYSLTNTSFSGYFIIYCLPDGLWYGALLVYQSSFLSKSKASRGIYLTSIILPFILELLQIYKDVPGTFDPLDLLVYFLTLTIFILFSNNRHVKE